MQAPDKATAQDSGGGFDPHPDGQHAVLCVDVVNLGFKLESYQGEPPYESPKVALVFASGERQEDKSLMLVTNEMTLSASDRANLRKFVEQWRGKSYTDEQVSEGIPLHKLQGQPALISVEHVLTKKKRKFAKIASIAPLPKTMPQPDKQILEEYVRPKFLEDKKAEYAKAVAKYREESGLKEEAEFPPRRGRRINDAFLMQKPDVVTASLPFAEIEAKIGIPPIASLLAERDELVKQVADLRARHGAFGTYNDLRKIRLSTIASMIRAKALEANTKVTESFIEEQAHAHPDYVGFVTTATEEKARWAILENQIEGITEQILRGNVIGRFLTAEISLVR